MKELCTTGRQTIHKELCRRGRRTSPSDTPPYNWTDSLIEGKWYEVEKSAKKYFSRCYVIDENGIKLEMSKIQFSIHFADTDGKRDFIIEEILK